MKYNATFLSFVVAMLTFSGQSLIASSQEEAQRLYLSQLLWLVTRSYNKAFSLLFLIQIFIDRWSLPARVYRKFLKHLGEALLYPARWS